MCVLVADLLCCCQSIDVQVERHMINGDVVIFNRQPSLHKMSMMVGVLCCAGAALSFAFFLIP